MKIIDTGTRMRGALLLAAAMSALGNPAISSPIEPRRFSPPRVGYEPDEIDEQRLEAAKAKRDRKNAKRLRESTQP